MNGGYGDGVHVMAQPLDGGYGDGVHVMAHEWRVW